MLKPEEIAAMRAWGERNGKDELADDVWEGVSRLLDEVERLQEVCSLAHGALVAAVATEDGLDGDDGLTVIRKIEKIMPSLTVRDIDEHGTDAQSTQVQPEA